MQNTHITSYTSFLLSTQKLTDSLEQLGAD